MPALEERMRLHTFGFIGIVAAVLVSACSSGGSGGGGNNQPAGPSTPTSSTPPLQFTAPTALSGDAGTSFSYSFCRPSLSSTSALCDSSSTNPTGGQPPYSFQLDSGSSLPAGLRLNLNGILNGTPTTATPTTSSGSQFSVCAVDLARNSVCRPVVITIAGSVALVGGFQSQCDRSADPLPGWLNCRGTIRLNVTATIRSGYVSAFMAFPDSGSFFHGETRVTAGTSPGTIDVAVVNNYVPRCPTIPYDTTINVYDGPQSGGATLIKSIPFRWTSCG